MALAPGARLGPYEVAAQIGVGGMGEVYQATDTNLKRQVAIKVLPEAVAADPERLARFQREAEVLAALNHPNIAHIHGLEKADGVTALVMELVEGPTLADRIAQGPIPVDEALAIAKQIAEALEAAHGQGIIHRDLKPANVKVREDGAVKVLDFGLAKAMEPAGMSGSSSVSMSPTITTPAMTEMGMILGTAAYMSPEQAKGRPADTRSDIWAFGAVLYEMLTGRRAFEGEDISETLADVMRVEPTWNLLPVALTPSLRTFLKRCLHKDRRQRVQAVGDVRLALEGAFETPAPPMAATVAPIHPVWRRALPPTAGAVLAGLVVGLMAWTLRPAAEAPGVTRFLHELPGSQTFRNTGRPVLALSHDGRQVVYNTEQGLYLRAMDTLEARLIPGTEAPLSNPFFSPDGQSVGFYQDGELKRVNVNGGAALPIGPAINPWGANWEADGTILFGQPEGVLRVPAVGGTPQVIIPAEEGEQVYGPRLLPGGDWVLFSVTTAGAWDEASIVVQSLSTNQRRVLVEGGSEARYVPTGYLVYAYQDGLFGIRFDLDHLTVSGGAVPLAQGIRRSGVTGAAHYDVSDSGTLVYVSGGELLLGGERMLVWVDRQGIEEPLALPLRGYLYPRVSPDGSRIVVSEQGAEGDIFLWDIARQVPFNLTADSVVNQYALWRDSSRVIFTSGAGTARRLYSISVDDTEAPELLTEGDTVAPQTLSADGSQLVFRQGGTDQADLQIVSLEGDHEVEDLIGTEANDFNAELSPNGLWMAYQSDRSGQNEIYVSSFPDVARRQQVSSAGGTRPAWARSGRELFYLDPDGRLMSVPVETDPGFSFARAEEVLDASDFFFGQGRSYDVALDDQRFLFVRAGTAAPDDDSPQVQIIVVERWLDELTSILPTP